MLALVPAEAVVAGGEDGDNGQEILGKLFLGVCWLGIIGIVHMELGAKLCEDMLDEFEGKPCESVAMGNDN